MQVELSKAELGLIHQLLLADVLADKDNHIGFRYEIVITGETATANELAAKFANLVIEAGQRP